MALYLVAWNAHQAQFAQYVILMQTTNLFQVRAMQLMDIILMQILSQFYAA